MPFNTLVALWSICVTIVLWKLIHEFFKAMKK